MFQRLQNRGLRLRRFPGRLECKGNFDILPRWLKKVPPGLYTLDFKQYGTLTTFEKLRDVILGEHFCKYWIYGLT